MNELLIVLSLPLIYGTVLLAYRFFGKSGLFMLNTFITVVANIEVLILVRAFGIEQTLGNVMFAATYLITDILGENESKKDARRAVWFGVITSLLMLVFTQFWFLYLPSESDWVVPYLKAIFSKTPRLIIAGFAGYLVSQFLDVWLYHRLWRFTESKSGSRDKFLWLRNNAATLISQAVNTVIFTTVAFAGWYSTRQVLTIMLSTYLIYIATSLLDTPAVYIARKLKRRGKVDIFTEKL